MPAYMKAPGMSMVATSRPFIAFMRHDNMRASVATAGVLDSIALSSGSHAPSSPGPIIGGPFFFIFWVRTQLYNSYFFRPEFISAI
eukprot:3611873-Ditylum_brightwellii.AAC.1